MVPVIRGNCTCLEWAINEKRLKYWYIPLWPGSDLLIFAVYDCFLLGVETILGALAVRPVSLLRDVRFLGLN